MIIRPATRADAERIAFIHNDAVKNSLAIWTDETVSAEDRAEWIATRQKAGFPVLVAEWDEEKVAGFASYGPFRDKEGYRHTAEHSVYIDHSFRGHGLGQGLMQALIEEAKASDIHVLMAGIEASNAISIKLHEKLGFTKAGTLREVGTKFGQWLDLTFMHLRVG